MLCYPYSCSRMAEADAVLFDKGSDVQVGQSAFPTIFFRLLKKAERRKGLCSSSTECGLMKPNEPFALKRSRPPLHQLVRFVSVEPRRTKDTERQTACLHSRQHTSWPRQKTIQNGNQPTSILHTTLRAITAIQYKHDDLSFTV
jgi:hypothetical protein